VYLLFERRCIWIDVLTLKIFQFPWFLSALGHMSIYNDLIITWQRPFSTISFLRNVNWYGFMKKLQRAGKLWLSRWVCGKIIFCSPCVVILLNWLLVTYSQRSMCHRYLFVFPTLLSIIWANDLLNWWLDTQKFSIYIKVQYCLLVLKMIPTY